MMSVTQLTRSASGQVRSRIKTLAGSLPHPDEEWTWNDAKELGMEKSDFQWLTINNQLRDVESSGRSGKYRTPQRLADAVRHYSEQYDGVEYPDDDPLPRLSD